MTAYSLSALRAVALRTQALHTANGSEPPAKPENIFQVVDQIGCVQIDTLHMVRRSHYLVPWSRMGNYNPADFDGLMFGPRPQLFEGWEHAASIIPLAEYRFQKPHQRNLREHPTNWFNRWLNDQVKKDFVPLVMERVRNEGGAEGKQIRVRGTPGGQLVELASGQGGAGVFIFPRRTHDRRPRKIPASLRSYQAGAAKMGEYQRAKC